MNLAEKLRKVLEIKNNIKAALEEKGIENVSNDFSTFAESIANISGGGEPEIPSIPEPPVIEIPESQFPKHEDVYASVNRVLEYDNAYNWTAPEDWIDLRTVLDENVIAGYPYRVAVLLKDGATCGLFTAGKVRLSDGTEYTVTSSTKGIKHTWTGEAINGYRWAIFYYNTKDITFTGGAQEAIYLLFDGVNANAAGTVYSFYGGGNSNVSTLSHSAGGNIEAIEGINGAFLYSKKTDGSIYSPISSSKKLVYFTPSILKVDRNSYFNECSSLKVIPKDVEFSSDITSFSSMFYGCSSLVTIPEINTSNGTSFSSMFRDCTSLITIPQIDTSKGTDFNNMFRDCTSLVTIPEIDTSKGTNFESMFQYCNSLVAVPEINTSKGTNFKYMFFGCSSLLKPTSLDFSSCNSSNSNYTDLFLNCSSLVTFPDIKNIDQLYLGAFDGCIGIKYLSTTIEFTSLSILTKFISLETIGYLYSNDTSSCSFPTNIKYIGSLIVPNSTKVSFADCLNLKYIEYADFSSASNVSFSGCSSLTTISLLNIPSCTDFSYMFRNCRSLVTIPLINTYQGTNFSYMFNGCSSLTNIPQLDTSNGTNFNYMFRNCSSIEEFLYWGDTFDFSNATGVEGIFIGCNSLKKLPRLYFPIATSVYNIFSNSSTSKIEHIQEIIAPLATTFNTFSGSGSYDSGFMNLNFIGEIDISSYGGTFYIPGKQKLTKLKFLGLVKCKLTYSSAPGSSYYSNGYKNNIQYFEIEAFDYNNQDFSSWRRLTKQALLNILNALVEQPEGTTKKMTLGTANLAKLTDEEKSIATEKGWTLA